jgi:hypothetical protein
VSRSRSPTINSGQNSIVRTFSHPIVCAFNRAPAQTMTSIKTHSLCIVFWVNELSVAQIRKSGSI